MIWFEHTQRTVLAGCRWCGSREIFTSQEAADRWALDHVNVAHPGPSPEHERFIRATAARRRRRA